MPYNEDKDALLGFCVLFCSGNVWLWIKVEPRTMSCAYVSLLFLLVLTAAVCRPTLRAPRLPRQLQEVGKPRVFQWGQGQELSMHDNGTMELKAARSHNCKECEVRLHFLCQRDGYSGCPNRTVQQEEKERLTSSIVMMQFTSAGKYLCMNRNATFYAVEEPSAEQLEECAFYIVDQKKDGRVLIYHFKYPEKKRGCRLAERRRRRMRRKPREQKKPREPRKPGEPRKPRKPREPKKSTEQEKPKRNPCIKYFLRKGSDRTLTVVKNRVFTESRWSPINKT